MKETILNNGLTIITDENKNSKICTLAYVVKSGSYDENENERGIAHLIEHMLFKGTTHRDYKSINKEIESIGGYLNAATNFEYTKYHCTIPCEEWETGLDVLSDMLFNHTLPEDELIKEKKVVQEELTMYDDDPSTFVSFKLIEEMFKKYPNRQLIGGTMESVGKITRDDLVDFINRNYFLENMIVIANGNVNHKEIVKFVENYIDKLHIDFNAYQKQYKSFEKYSLDKEIIEFKRNDVEQTHLSFGLFGPGYNHEDTLPLQILSIMLGGNCSSVLYNIIREQKGLAYSIGMDIDSMNDVSVIIGHAGLNRESKVIEEILHQFEIINDYIDNESVESAKVYLVGMLYIKMEHSSGINDFLTDQLIHENKDSIDTVVNQIKQVTIKDVQRVAKTYFTESNISFVKLN